MNGISTLLCSLQQALDEVSSIEGVVLILGGSLVRPLFVYDITISHGIFDPGSAKEHALTKLAQSVSRKVNYYCTNIFPWIQNYTIFYDLFLVKH